MNWFSGIWEFTIWNSAISSSTTPSTTTSTATTHTVTTRVMGTTTVNTLQTTTGLPAITRTTTTTTTATTTTSATTTTTTSATTSKFSFVYIRSDKKWILMFSHDDNNDNDRIHTKCEGYLSERHGTGMFATNNNCYSIDKCCYDSCSFVLHD